MIEENKMKKSKSYFYLGSCERNILGSYIEENRYDNENYQFDINSKNDSHTAIARKVKENSCVLDIGCASGLMGELLKKYKNCIVDGIECDSAALKVAQKRGCYRDLFHFSVTDKSKKYHTFFAEKRKYDYILFCDVLEHLDKPWEVLAEVYPLLKKDGHILICLPNIAHIDIIRALMNQEFNYCKVGLLDSTHIRFFTASSFGEMIQNLADTSKVYYSINLYEQISISPPYIEECTLLKDEKNLKELLVLQNVFDLIPSSSKENMKINIPKYNHNFFEELNQKYKLEKSELIEQNKALFNEKSELVKKNQELLAEREKILNSKRWKLISKVADLKNITKRESKK